MTNLNWLRAHKLLLLGLFAAVVTIAGAAAWWRLREPTLNALAQQVSDKVSAIRGRPFVKATSTREITSGQARAFIREQMAEMPRIENYWAVMRTLGLYRGPDREEPEVLWEELVNLAAGAYDSERDEMLVIWELDRAQREVLLSHELCHALQDQHFDLDRYLLRLARNPETNADELLARQAVVEGEATYVDAIYQAHAAGIPQPSREQIAQVLDNQPEWHADSWESLLTHPELDGKAREQVRLAIETRDRLPAFFFELFMSPYLDGANFIHAVQERGWDAVDRLYGDEAPISTEQILHPEKWLAREAFARIEWPAFDERFSDWRLLHENTLGERQWQMVFRAQGLAELAESAAAGWNGDRFAVFRHRKTGSMLLLMHTAWDSPEDAAEFADAYLQLQGAKYPEKDVPAGLMRSDRAVWIVEGSDPGTIEGFVDFAAGAQWYDSRP